MKPLIIGTLLLLGAFGCKDQPTRPSPGPETVTVRIKENGQEGGPFLSRSPLDLIDLIERASARDSAGVADMVRAGRVVLTDKCEAIVTARRQSWMVRVRVTTGEYAGQEFWVPEQWTE